MNIRIVIAITVSVIALVLHIIAEDAKPSSANYKDAASLRAFNESRIGALICVYEIERSILRPGQEQLEFRATVVDCLKGNWKVGQRIICRKPIDDAAIVRLEPGDLRFLFTDATGEDGSPIVIADGEFAAHSESLQNMLESIK